LTTFVAQLEEDAIALKFETRVDAVFYHAAAKPGTDIPYRALLPKGLEGILVAGRCASMTAEAAGGVRAQVTVMQLGEAASDHGRLSGGGRRDNVRDGTTLWRVLAEVSYVCLQNVSQDIPRTSVSDWHCRRRNSRPS
jgi:hypothetical protein